MDKGFKYRIYPTPKQRAAIEGTFGCCRWVFNMSLEVRQRAWEADSARVSATDCIKMIPGWKKDNPWLAGADAVALQQSIRDCDKALQSFFRRCKQGGKPGYPKFKSAKSPHQSYRTQNPNGRKTIEVFEADNRIKLPKLGKVKAKISRPPEGRIVNATISKDAAGRYFVTLCCTGCSEELLPESSNAVGIDLGIENQIVCSNGEKIDNPRYAKRYEKKLAREQRRLSRKQIGSNNRKRQQRKVAKVHAKIADSRRDHIHKATTKLVRENQVIAAESLNVRGMLRNHRLAKHVADASFGEICRQLKYKTEWHGRTFVQVDAWYPSSKTCSVCGWMKSDLTLRDRGWGCEGCGARHDRDVNAAINVLNEGLKALNGTAGHAGTAPQGENACGDIGKTAA